jgi:hypothetical protein
LDYRGLAFDLNVVTRNFKKLEFQTKWIGVKMTYCWENQKRMMMKKMKKKAMMTDDKSWKLFFIFFSYVYLLV